MKLYDVIIIGGGPSALTAGLYIARAGKSVAIFEKNIEGGRIVESNKVDNIPGLPSISGAAFGIALTEQATNAGADFYYQEVTRIVPVDAKEQYVIETSEDSFLCTIVVVATGTKPRMLGLENEDKLVGNGISFCAVCDGAFYKDKAVAVIGGGNAALTEALELADVCEAVTVFQNLPYLTADQVLIDQVNARDNIACLCNRIIVDYEISDDGKLTGFFYRKSNSDRLEIRSIDGIFLAIGMIPQTDLVKNLVELDQTGYIVTKNGHCTSRVNIFACGDCRSNPYKQVVIACGDGATTALEILDYLRKKN